MILDLFDIVFKNLLRKNSCVQLLIDLARIWGEIIQY